MGIGRPLYSFIRSMGRALSPTPQNITNSTLMEVKGFTYLPADEGKERNYPNHKSYMDFYIPVS